MQRDADTPPEPAPPQPPDLRLPPELRLRASTRIREVLDRGQRAAGERVLLVGLPNELGHARLACVCGRRFDKRAVVRNRWRRRIREIFRVRRSELEGSDPGWDWVAVALKREGPIAFARLAKDLLGAAVRARKAKPGPPPGRTRR